MNLNAFTFITVEDEWQILTLLQTSVLLVRLELYEVTMKALCVQQGWLPVTFRIARIFSYWNLGNFSTLISLFV